MGKTPYQQVKSTTTAMLVTSMLVNDLNISDLWRLDVIRINDSAEIKTKIQAQPEVDRIFQDTISSRS